MSEMFVEEPSMLLEGRSHAEGARRIKVMDFVPLYSREMGGGFNRYLSDKIGYVARTPNLEHVVVLPGKRDDTRRQGRSVIHEVKSFHLLGSKSYRLLMNTERVEELLDLETPDVLEVGSALWPTWKVVDLANVRGVATAGFYHSDFPRSFGEMLGKYLNSSTVDRVVTGLIESYVVRLYNSMSVTVSATRQYAGQLRALGVERVARIPLGTDTEIFRPRESRDAVFRELGLSRDTRLLLYVGRLAAIKNIEQLLVMMDEFGPADGPMHLLVIGDGEERELLEDASETRSDISWYGYIGDRHRLAGYYSAADLFINAGTYETFGLVSLEAQACGVRVLGVRGGGMEETLEGEERLIMADSEEPWDLARAVREILCLGEGLEAHRRRRQRIVQEFSLDTCFNRLFSLYSHILDIDTMDSSSYSMECNGQ